MKPKTKSRHAIAASRLLLAASAAIFAFGAVMHAIAYHTKAQASIAAAGLPRFLALELNVLWLADSTTLLGLALVFGFVALKPRAATGSLIILLCSIPAGTTALLYLFLGPFYAGHLLLLACATAIGAGLLMLTATDGDTNVPARS